MTRYISARLLATIPVLFGVTILVFSMLYLIPGDPVKMMLSEFQTSPEQIARMRAQLHLNDPFAVQYGRFVWNGLHGDLGTSIRDNRPVSQEISEVLPQTVQLAVAALALSSVLGVTLGIVAALRQNTWVDVGTMMLATLGISMPSFWLALILIFIFSLHLEVLPAAGGGDLAHLIMPTVALGLGAAAIVARLTRSNMLEVLRMEYVNTARAKGLGGPTVVLRHALLNALIPVITIFGLQFGTLLAGTVFIETVFGRPGLGRLLVDAIQNKDFPLVQGGVLVVAVGYVFVNLLVDVAYAVVDPRIRYG
ncbi:MAG TPA: ABC transporter permease [bacterium]|nr:ABC transporter permease [bacterium]